MAVYDGDTSKVQSLLKQGANPNHHLYWSEEWWKKKYGKWRTRSPPLHTACNDGYLEIAKLLVKHGADVDKGDDVNFTPLHYASEEGHKKVVVYLIREAGCKIGE